MKKCTRTRRGREKYKKTELKKEGDQQFTGEERNAEITVDPVLQAKSKMSDNRVNGPEDAVVSQMIKQLLLGKIHLITRCFQERFMGQMEAPSSWKIVKLVFLRKQDAQPKKDRKLPGHCAHICVSEVVHILCFSSLGAG